MKNHRPFILLLTIFVSLTLVGCNLPQGTENTPNNTENATDSEYDGELTLEGRRYSYLGDPENITAKADRLIIKKGGRYLLRGELSEGRIAVDSQSEVTLCLGGVSISSSVGIAIEQRGRGGLRIETLSGSINYLSVGNFKTDSLLPTGCISAEGDITLLGEGSIVISSKADTAVVSASGIYIDSGSLTLGCEGYGLWSGDRISINGGTLKITHCNIGLYAYGGEYSHGRIEMLGGTLVALCRDTAIFAEREINVSGGSADIRAETVYKCQREAEGKTVQGKIEILAESFPKHEKANEK